MTERKVAGSASELMEAARTVRDAAECEVLFCGLTVRIAPAPQRDYFGTRRLAEHLEEKQGKPYREQVESQIAWVTACLVEPKMDLGEVNALAAVNPAEFEKLARVCEHISSGQPLTIWALGILMSHVIQVRDAADEGTLPRHVADFWSTVLGAVYGWLDSGDATTMPDFKALGATFGGDDIAIEKAIEQTKAWAAQLAGGTKNASAALSTDTNSGSPSSGPTDTPES